jgi:hypothetical protein
VIIVGWQIFSKRKLPWLCVALSLAATFVNPYGWEVYIEVIRTVVDSNLRTKITEWHPILLPWPSAFYVAVFAGLHLALAKKPIRKIVSLPGLLLVMAFSSIRHFPLFEASSLRYLEKYQNDLSRQITKQKLSTGRKAVILGMIVVFLGFFGWLVWLIGKEAKTNGSIYPTKALQYLASHPCQGNLFNSYNYGGYIIWQLPNQKVYIDGRMPSWKDRGEYYLQNYFDFYTDQDFRNREIAHHDIRCILVSNNDFKDSKDFISSLESKGWRKIDEGSSHTNTLLINAP